MPAAARQLLLATTPFAGLLAADRVVFKSPPKVTSPFCRLQVPSAGPRSGDGVMWEPLLQADFYAPATGDAEKVVWDLAAAAADVFGHARNVTFENVTYSGRMLDGPIPSVDTSRGESEVLARAVIRAELRLHAR